jgi:hypothetical protein
VVVLGVMEERDLEIQSQVSSVFYFGGCVSFCFLIPCIFKNIAKALVGIDVWAKRYIQSEQIPGTKASLFAYLFVNIVCIIIKLITINY